MEEELIGIIGKLVDLVEMASPQLWAMAQREVYVSIARLIFWGIFTFVVGAILACLARAEWAKFKEDERNRKFGDHDAACAASGTVAIFCFIVIASIIDSIIALAINPQLAAVRVLLSLIK